MAEWDAASAAAECLAGRGISVTGRYPNNIAATSMVARERIYPGVNRLLRHI